MNIDFIESAIIALIIIVQIGLFVATKRKITNFANSIEDPSKLRLMSLTVPYDDFEVSSASEIYERRSQYAGDVNPDSVPEGGSSSFTIVEAPYGSNDDFKATIGAINTSILSSRSGTADFNLIKDITDRQSDALEEEIHLTISTPLFLGLMGTMAGIVVSLFSMSNMDMGGEEGFSSDAIGQGISVLLGGVKIAMLASFTGLFLTTLNSGWFFKIAKSKHDKRKAEFYTYVQTSLLPYVDGSIGSTFESLQRNLAAFNGEFGANLNKLSGIFQTNYDALVLQERLLSSIEKVDIASVAKYNVKVLKELTGSLEQFEKFNLQLSMVNTAVENSQQLISRINELLERTENLESIATKIETTIEDNKRLFEFIDSNFRTLDDLKQKTNVSIGKTAFAIEEMFDELKLHIGKSLESLKTFSIQEVGLLQDAFSQSRTNLGNLQFLEQIKEELAELKATTVQNTNGMQDQLKVLNSTVGQSVGHLRVIEHKLPERRMAKVWHYVKGKFKRSGA